MWSQEVRESVECGLVDATGKFILDPVACQLHQEDIKDVRSTSNKANSKEW